MRAVDIIQKKRDNARLNQTEIEFFVQGFADGSIPDYQAAAWAMAVLLNGMDPEETTQLTLAMAASGETLDLSGLVDIAVDKHSTGGVGDKTSLVVCPVVSACGLPVGKMSGRGLGFSGGTLDKLESIPGYRCDLTTEAFKAQLKAIGLVLTGQSADLAPADGKLYSLRDVTATVPSIPLIASSVMSKKLAAGAQAMVLDVKSGLGAFMATLEEARLLSELMVEIARISGREAIALLSYMNQPLGQAVGNSLELKEAIDTLHGAGPADFREHCLEVAAHMLVLGRLAADHQAAMLMATQALQDGRGWAKFRQLVSAQGGDLAVLDDPDRLPQARHQEEVTAPESGFLSQIHARIIGETAVEMGGGRAQKPDAIDHAVGILIYHNVGDFVEAGAPLFGLHSSDPEKHVRAKARVLAAHQFSPQPVDALPLFSGTINYIQGWTSAQPCMFGKT